MAEYDLYHKIFMSMRAKGMGQVALAKKMGVSQGTVSDWIHGAYPRPKILIKLGKILDIDVTPHIEAAARAAENQVNASRKPTQPATRTPPHTVGGGAVTKAELEERIRQMGQPILQRLHPDDIDAIARRVVEIQKEPGESTPSISNDKVRELLKNPKKK